MVVGQVAEPFDLVVAGAGPGGYVAALHGARLGRRVALVDRDGAQGVGGVCLRQGCIPSKALIEAAELEARIGGAKAMGLKARPGGVDMKRFQAWKNGVVARLTDGVRGLLKAAAVEVIAGELRLTGADTGVIEPREGQARFLNFADLVLATGSRPAALAELPFDGDRVLDSAAALDLEEVPRNLAIVGAGYIGLEIGTAFAKLGSRVAIVEAEEGVLPTLERRLVRPVAQRLEALGVEVLDRARVRGYTGHELEVEGADGVRLVPADKVVVAVGRRPNSDDLGLESAGIEADAEGRLPVAPDRRLSAHVAAIGDITPGPALAHKAMHEAAVAAEALSGRRAAFQPAAIPAVVFSDPEIATAGLSAEAAAAQGLDAEVAMVPLAASGRAATLGAHEGFMQVVADRADGAVVGVHIVGPEASELIAEGVLAIEMGASLEDLALAIHPHPSLSEQYGEAAHLALGRPIHMSLVSGR
jgi:dihydrolipoamide dehydrogenase